MSQSCRASGLPGRLCRGRALGFGFPGWPGVRLGFGGGYELVEVGAEFRVGHRPVAGAWGCRDPFGLVPPPELGLGRPGCLSVLCVRLGPLAAGGVGDGEPGEVLGGIAPCASASAAASASMSYPAM